jgi:hypothetical protein
MATTQKWYEAYKTAVLETDWTKMEERIRAAESAIRDREREFSLNQGGTDEEMQEIVDALSSLSVLRKDATSWTRGNGSTG